MRLQLLARQLRRVLANLLILLLFMAIIYAIVRNPQGGRSYSSPSVDSSLSTREFRAARTPRLRPRSGLARIRADPRTRPADPSTRPS